MKPGQKRINNERERPDGVGSAAELERELVIVNGIDNGGEAVALLLLMRLLRGCGGGGGGGVRVGVET